MKKIIYITLFATLACSADDIDSMIETETSEETESEPDVDFRSGPVFEESETHDQCCPRLADGRTLDWFCGNDVSNTCPVSSGYTTGWALDGSTVSSWTLVNCYTCGANSYNCSSTRWINNGIGGNECGGTAIRKSTNALVDDNCGQSSCTSQTLWCPNVVNIPQFVDPESAGYSLTDYCTTWKYEASVTPLCCRPGFQPANDPFVQARCIIADRDSNGDATCTNGPNADKYEDSYYDDLMWCHTCISVNPQDEESGSWDLRPDSGSPWSTEWGSSIWSIDLSSLSTPPETWATEFNCGGYLYYASGNINQNFCE